MRRPGPILGLASCLVCLSQGQLAAQAVIGTAKLTATSSYVTATATAAFDSYAAAYYFAGQADVSSAKFSDGSTETNLAIPKNYNDNLYVYPYYTSTTSGTLAFAANKSYRLQASILVWYQVYALDASGNLSYFDPCSFSLFGFIGGGGGGSYRGDHPWIGFTASRTTTVASSTVLGEVYQTLDPVAVTLSPATATLNQGATQQFTAQVTGGATGNTAVTWSLTPSLGTLSQAGLYTAPTGRINGTKATVTATSVADTTKKASASITLVPDLTATMTQPASDLVVMTGTTVTFAADASSNDTSASVSYTWDFGLGESVAGQTATHTYVNSGTASKDYVVTLTVRGSSGGMRQVTRKITVLNPTLTGSIVAPATDQIVNSGTSIAFTATATDDDPKATLIYAWDFGDGATGSGPNVSHTFVNHGCTINPDPLQVKLHITGSTGGKAVDLSRSVKVLPVIAVASVSPSGMQVYATDPVVASFQFFTTQAHFSATVTGTDCPGVNWTCNGGTIQPDGTYSSPVTAGNYTVTAQSQTDQTKSLGQTVRVVPPPSVALKALNSHIGIWDGRPMTITLNAYCPNGLSDLACSSTLGDVTITQSFNPKVAIVSVNVPGQPIEEPGPLATKAAARTMASSGGDPGGGGVGEGVIVVTATSIATGESAQAVITLGPQ